jgi:hypothetical protein
MKPRSRVIQSPAPERRLAIPLVDTAEPESPEPPPLPRFSTLAQIFLTERHRQRAGNVGYSLPAFSEIEAAPDIEPLLATNMKGTFLRTRLSSLGHARFGFSEIDVAQEAVLLLELHRVLVAQAAKEGWRNVVSTVPEALSRMREFGIKPSVLLAAAPEVEGIQGVPVACFPEGVALVVGPAEAVGLHTRIGAHVGILAYRVSTAFVAVQS